MNKNRIEIIKTAELSIDKGEYVLYWMQQSMRVNYNHALNYAIERANESFLPVLVYFTIDTAFPYINKRSLFFMLEGLEEVKEELTNKGINFIIEIGNVKDTINKYLKHTMLLITDKGYLRYQKSIREECFGLIDKNYPNIRIVMIDQDVIVPVNIVSQKVEYGAYTIRPKITKMYLDYLDFHNLKEVENKTKLNYQNIDIKFLYSVINVDESVFKSEVYIGGYSQAKKILYDFINNKLNYYLASSDPGLDLTSKLSMYLHFGQISSLEILGYVLQAISNKQIDKNVADSFIEQVLIRRELAYNYVTYNKYYDNFSFITESWAYKTMNEHANDKKEYIYSISEMIKLKTHDIYFNAAMKEMLETGYMHNYMRMYWAKKIIEWTPTFEEAYNIIVLLNNKYFIDGRDANSYAGIAWCFGKHDRPWKERNIFGKLRYMNDKGLERKFDINKYINRINSL